MTTNQRNYYLPQKCAHWPRVPFALLVALLLLPACSTIQTVDTVNPDALRSRLSQGDRLKITRFDGTETEIILVRIEPHQIVGKAQTVSFTDIQSVGLRVSDPGNTVLAILGSVLLGVLAATVLFSESVKNEFN